MSKGMHKYRNCSIRYDTLQEDVGCDILMRLLEHVSRIRDVTESNMTETDLDYTKHHTLECCGSCLGSTIECHC